MCVPIRFNLSYTQNTTFPYTIPEGLTGEFWQHMSVGETESHAMQLAETEPAVKDEARPEDLLKVAFLPRETTTAHKLTFLEGGRRRR